MTTVTLKLGFRPRADRETAAWYIASGDPVVWLEEVSAWDVSQAAIRFYVLPYSSGTRQPGGVLVCSLQGKPSHVSRHVIPFGVIANRVFVPVESQLDPVVSDADLGTLFSDSYTYVWHPAVGLVAFEADEILGVGDLLSFGPPATRSWNCARPGIAVSHRLHNLVPETTPSLEEMLQEGRDDIGTQTNTLSKLPPSPSEPKLGRSSAASLSVKQFFAKVTQWIVQQVPERDHGANWINSIGEWAQKYLREYHSKLDAARHKEIIRLMHLLDTNPEFGLRFAIPFGGDAHRGLATPNARLTARNTDFQLNQLGGGHAADFWNISPDYQAQLIARYRELANREMRLGRHRRAAYIFAELINDFHAAAGALVGGGHWREASAVYKLRLNNPREAAQCLEQGGLWMEAIAEYEELEAHEPAGDLYLKLDQVDAAKEQYRKAVHKCHAQGDFLSSARLLEHKLKSVDEAIDELFSGWPRTPHAGQCLREMFRVLGRHGRHEMAQQRIAEFRNSPLPERNRTELVNILVDTALKYPHQSAQAQSADCVRALVSRQLRDASSSDSQQLLTALSRLVPQDYLLGRDCQRYLRQAPETPKASPPRLPAKTIRLRNRIQLPNGEVSWETATLSGDSIFVAGKVNDELVLSRCSWTDPESPRLWKIDPSFSDFPIILAGDASSPDFVLVHIVGAPTLTSLHEFKSSARFPFTTKAGAIPGMSSDALAAARTPQGITWLLEVRNGHFTLVAIGLRGEQISTETVNFSGPTQEYTDVGSVIPVPLHCRYNKVYVGVRNQLHIFDRVKPAKTIEFGQRITSLVGSRPNMRSRVVATFERGGTVFWDEFGGTHGVPFASDMANPIVCINRGGFLIAVSQNYCEVYSSQSRRVQWLAEMEAISPDPVAVLPGPSADSFGILSAKGTLDVYEIS